MSIYMGDTLVAGIQDISGKQDKATALNYDNISNCITHIPQDIKLELNNGTLTLKAGSKVYVPNGDGVFDEIIIDSDKSVEFQSWGSNTRMFFYNPTTDNFTGNILAYTTSGSSASPSSPVWVWYDTTNNLVKRTENSGSTWESGWSIPICVCTNVQNTSSSIDQVFNGFGYIGSTVFALPGVKGLIPNGRNADGSLKNTECLINSVITYNETHTNSQNTLYTDGTTFESHAIRNVIYDEKLNYLMYNNTKQNGFVFANVFLDGNTKITGLTTKSVFHALDYNDKGTIAGWGIPSNSYIDISLGSSGSTYTAPANGYMFLTRTTGNQSNQACQLFVNGSGRTNCIYMSSMTTNPPQSTCSTWIPVKKNDVITYAYTASGALAHFRFVYAQGEI